MKKVLWVLFLDTSLLFIQIDVLVGTTFYKTPYLTCFFYHRLVVVCLLEYLSLSFQGSSEDEPPEPVPTCTCA